MSISERTVLVNTETADPLAALRDLLDELREAEQPFVGKLRDVLAKAGGTRLETKEEMKQFASMVNEALDRLGATLTVPKTGEPARLTVKSTQQGRYPLFTFKLGGRGTRGGPRKIPEAMSFTLDT